MLHFLGAVILSPLIAFSLEVELLTQAFHFMPSASFAEQRQAAAKKKIGSQKDGEIIKVAAPESNLKGDGKVAANMQWDLKNATRIKTQSYLMTMFGCCFSRQKDYKKMLAKAKNSITRELDLVKFLQRQRLSQYAMMATLNSR